MPAYRLISADPYLKDTAFGAATILVGVSKEPADTEPGRSFGRTPSPDLSTIRPAGSSPPQLIGKIPEKLEENNAFISSNETVRQNFDSRSNLPSTPRMPPRDLVVGGDEHGNSPTREGEGGSVVSSRGGCRYPHIVRFPLIPTSGWIRCPQGRNGGHPRGLY